MKTPYIIFIALFLPKLLLAQQSPHADSVAHAKSLAIWNSDGRNGSFSYV